MMTRTYYKSPAFWRSYRIEQCYGPDAAPHGAGAGKGHRTAQGAACMHPGQDRCRVRNWVGNWVSCSSSSGQNLSAVWTAAGPHDREAMLGGGYRTLSGVRAPINLRAPYFPPEICCLGVLL